MKAIEMKTKLVKSTYSGEALLHKEIWRAAVKLAEISAAEQKGALYFDLSSLLLTACAVEGHANYLLSIVSPVVFANEREFFSGRGEFVGTVGKLKWLAKEAQFDLIGHAGYTSVCEVQALRDHLAHCKPQCYEFFRIHPLEEDPPMFPKEARHLEGRIHRLVREGSMLKIQSLADALHSAVESMTIDPMQRRRLLPRAFDGLLGLESVGSTLANK